MKKRLLLKGLLAALMLGSPLSGMAYHFTATDVNGNTIYYNITDKTNLTCEVTSSSDSYSGDIVIPDSVEYKDETNGTTTKYAVTSIGYSAFMYCEDLTSVEIPSTVTSIASSAFYYCTGLTSVVIPSSVDYIGNDAFKGCTSLTSVVIPSSVENIGNHAFASCNTVYLTSTTYPTIKDETFNTDNLKALYVPVGQKEDYADDDDWSAYSSKMIGYIPSASTKALMNVDGFDDKYWGTIYTSAAVNVPEGITVYTMSSIDEEEIPTAVIANVAKAGQTIPAGAYLISSATQKDSTIFVESSATPVEISGENLLDGKIVDTDLSGSKYYILSGDANGENIGFYWASSDGSTLSTKAYKAYLPLSSAAGAKAIMLVSDSYASGINSVSSETAKSGKIYNLQGIEVRNTIRL